MHLQLVLKVLALATVAIATPYRRNCAEFTDCATCASNLSWLGTSCRWCPIDRKCHEAGSVKNSCSEGHNIMDPSRCLAGNHSDAYKFNPELSLYAAILSGAAYAPNASECVANFLATERLLDLKHVNVNCDLLTDDCSAFVARSDRRKLIIVSFRGTHGKSQLIVEGLMGMASPKQESRIGGKVQEYFYSAFIKVWDELLPSVRQLLQLHSHDHKVLVTGHSLGGAMASLAAAELAAFHSVPASSLVYYSFGQPRVGNFDFAAAFDALVPNSWRVVHADDIVVHLPVCSPVMAKEQKQLNSSKVMAVGDAFSCSSRFGFPYHHGTEVFFPRGVAMTPETRQFRVCRGVPLNEDATCANSADNWGHCFNPAQAAQCVRSHLVYYAIHLGKWWDINLCKAVTDPDLI